MAGKKTIYQMTYKVGSTDGDAGIPQNSIVVFDTEDDSVKLASGSSVIPVGVTMNDERVADYANYMSSQTGKNIAVTVAGVVELIAKGEVKKGDVVAVADDSSTEVAEISTLTTPAFCLGIAESDAAEGEKVFVKLAIAKL